MEKEQGLFSDIDNGINKFLSNGGNVTTAIDALDKLMLNSNNNLIFAALSYAKQKLLCVQKEQGWENGKMG